MLTLNLNVHNETSNLKTVYDGWNIFTKKMSLDKLKNKIKESIFTLYSNNELNIQFQKTKKNFDGDLTIVVFPLLVVSKKSPSSWSAGA